MAIKRWTSGGTAIAGSDWNELVALAEAGAASAAVAGRTPVYADALGIEGDGTTQVGTKLQTALDNLKAGEMLHLTPGKVYNHTDSRLIVRRDNAGLEGNGAVLLSNDPVTGGLRVDGEYSGWCKTGGVIRRLRHVVNNATTRTGQNKDRCPLAGWRTSNMLVEDVQTEGSDCAGMFFARVTGLINRNPVVYGCKADGIHHTDGTKQVLVVRPISIKVGDDGVAVVSYIVDAGGICEDITVLTPFVQKTYGGRGLTVVGGRRIRYYGGEASETFAAGVLVSCEKSYNTFGVEDVKILGTLLSDTNMLWAGERTDIPDHGAVIVESAVTGRAVKDVDIKVKVRNTNPAKALMGDRVGRDSTSSAYGTFENVRIEATVEGLYNANATSSNPQINSQSANLGVTPRPVWDVRLGGRYAAAPA
jgi:hypothetical protein